jgi:hypothetical protein
MSDQVSPETLLKLQMAPKLILRISLGSMKKEPRYACLSEAKECEPRFPPSPHITYTMDCPAVLVGKGASSGCYDQ